VFVCNLLFGQIRIVNSTSNTAAPASSAFIDASSNPTINSSPNLGKGILFPRVSLNSFSGFGGNVVGTPNNYPNHYDGLIVYNTSTSGTAGVGNTQGSLSPGFWYYDNKSGSLTGGTWKPVSVNSSSGGANYTGSASISLNGSSFERAALEGDVVAALNENTSKVVGLQGKPVSDTAPVSGQILQYDGSSWIAATPASASSSDIYTSDGTLTGNRHVQLAGKTLGFSGGNVGIGTANPSAGSILDLTSTDKALLLPRLSGTSSVVSPVDGMLMYDSSAKCVKAFADNQWSKCMGASLDFLEVECTTGGFRGIYISGYAQINSKFVVTVKNNSSTTVSLNFSQSDLSLSGISGLSVGQPTGVPVLNNNNITLSPGSSVELSYPITGTPSGSGLLSGTWSNSSLSCTQTVNVTDGTSLPPGTINSLDCAGAANNGSLIKDVAANYVSTVISYTGGNGGTYVAQSVASTGVTGLTASLVAGTFANGAGTLTYQIIGTPGTLGVANFSVTIGGQTCTFSRTVSSNPSTVTPGSGSLSGRTCFDVVMTESVGCGTLSSRASQKADFTLPTINTQTYTFTPIGTVSNVRFAFININGSVILSLTGGNSGNNITAPVDATAIFNTSLNSLATGVGGNNPLKAEIYVIFNDGPTNNGTDRQIKLTAKVQDCSCCGAYISDTNWIAFMCHNLGADESLDPFIPAKGLHGAKYQWGRKTPVLTMAQDQASSATIPGWDNTNLWPVDSLFWMGGIKTNYDPCPDGYSVPSRDIWEAIRLNNTLYYTGTWTPGENEYLSGFYLGRSPSDRTLFFPNAGYRGWAWGELVQRGSQPFYPTAEISWGGGSFTAYYVPGIGHGLNVTGPMRSTAMPVRCVANR